VDESVAVMGGGFLEMSGFGSVSQSGSSLYVRASGSSRGDVDVGSIGSGESR